MAAFPQTVADLQTFIIATAQPAIDGKFDDAVMHQEREKDQLSERIDSIESTLTTEIGKVEREAKEQSESLQQAMLERLTAELSSADAGVKTQIGDAKT